MNQVGNVDQYTSSCGYCSSGDSGAMGMWAHKLSCEAYQDLLDRGWRRSGQWVYRPLPDKEAACQCHPYTIRLDANKFQPSKDQRKVLRRFEAYLDGKRCKPQGQREQQQGDGAEAQPSSAQPEEVPLNRQQSGSKQQWLADVRKRKSHLISPSPIASPTKPQSLAEEASETLASPELAAMISAELNCSAQSPMGEADCLSDVMSEGTEPSIDIISRGAVPVACSASGVDHVGGQCPEQGSGCCTPVGSDESANSALAIGFLGQPSLQWPEQLVAPSDQRLDKLGALQQQSDDSQTLTAMAESAIQQAIQQLILAGQFPSMQCPVLPVKVPSRKQQKVSHGKIVLTSPAAHVLAAAARHEQGGSSVSAKSLAEALARQIGSGAAVLRDKTSCRLTARAEAGHLNFLRQEGPATDQHGSFADAHCSLARDQHGACSNANATRKLDKSTKAQVLPRLPRSATIDITQHQSPRQQWSIPASYADQSECKVSEIRRSARISNESPSSLAGVVQEGVPAKQGPFPASKRSGAEQAQQQSSQAEQPSGASCQLRSIAPRERTQKGRELNIHPIAKLRTLHIRTLPASDDLVEMEFPLYRKYQMLHHGEDPAEVTELAFRRFLVDTPLAPSFSPGGIRFGSFHQQYWIDDKLIAVGVVDVLPRCLSSAYLFWDPDLAWLGLGKLTALKEIAWVQAASVPRPSLQWYHMGYFLETCPKMRYKADFHPSELLCMRTYAWVPLPVARPALQADSHCAIGMIAGYESSVSAGESEGSMNGSDVLINCGDPQGERQLLRLGELPDAVDRDTQEMVVLLRARLRAWQQLAGPITTTFIVVV